MNNYQMPVKAIKSILLKEHKDFMQSSITVTWDYGRYIKRIADEKITRIIESIQTYDELEDFIGDSRRMSLQEWIDSL